MPHYRLCLALLFLCPSLVLAANEPLQPTVVPDQLATVRLSNSDMNRISCPGTISDVLSSAEKGVMITITGQDAFIKFKVQSGEPPIYRETPTELFVVCQGSTYSLIALPQRIPAQTIRLAPAQRQAVEQNQARFEGLPFEQRLVRIMQELAQRSLPESYEQEKLQEPPRRYKEMTIQPHKRISIPGEGLVIHIFRITAISPITLLEQTLLEQQLVPNPLALALEREQLEAGETMELVVIAKRHGSMPGSEPLVGLPSLAPTTANTKAEIISQGSPRNSLEVPHARRP